MNFPFSTALAASHKFWYVVLLFSPISKFFLTLLVISSLDHWYLSCHLISMCLWVFPISFGHWFLISSRGGCFCFFFERCFSWVKYFRLMFIFSFCILKMWLHFSLALFLKKKSAVIIFVCMQYVLFRWLLLNCSFYCFLFFKRFYLFILERGEGREKERERNIYRLPLTHPHLAHNPGMCSDWELNQPPWITGQHLIH